MKVGEPQVVYVSPEAAEDPLTKKILLRLPHAQVCYLPGSGDPITEQSVLGPPEQMDVVQLFAEGKKRLFLTHQKGAWMRSCPGTLHHVCCNLWTVDLGEGCPMDCTYCYLQSYLQRNPTLKIYTNTPQMLEELENRLRAEPKRLFRVCTGEVIDSLVWDPLTDWSVDLVRLFARLPNAILELKTKTDNISNLIALKGEHLGKTVISWSVNSTEVAANDEADTVNLEARIKAAESVVECGYRVGFHFDPVVHYPGWQDGYRETVKKIFSRINPQSVAWVSISTLRYQKNMQSVMIKRFPHSKLPYGNQFLASDQKLRYIQPLRFQLLSFLWDEIKAVSPQMPVYMCMESGAAWRTIAGGPPAAGSELGEIYTRKVLSAGAQPSLDKTYGRGRLKSCF